MRHLLEEAAKRVLREAYDPKTYHQVHADEHDLEAEACDPGSREERLHKAAARLHRTAANVHSDPNATNQQKRAASTEAENASNKAY
jgi:hypothetical protein